ncbi:MAG: sugar transferase [Bacteroidota bacterium]
MTQFLHPLIQRRAKVIVLVGSVDFPRQLSQATRPQGQSLRFREFDQSFSASAWLQERASGNKHQELPYAIIADYHFLEEDNFRLLDSVRSESTLRQIPFIAMTDDLSVIDRQAALQLGIDDCFELETPWAIIEDRIRFLEQFKSTLIDDTSAQEVESFEYKRPLSKRIFDIVVVSLLAGPIGLVVLLAIIAVRIESKGKVFYSAKRVGTGYQVFPFHKIRSMYQNADQRLKELQHLNQYSGADANCFTKIENDPRVTRVGKFIRKYSIDELPQFYNVLKGEMSIVGNRPLPVYEAEQLTRDGWAMRFIAPAGITGLWQVDKRGKDNMSAQERIALDVEYAENYSVWGDIKILLMTIPALFRQGDM